MQRQKLEITPIKLLLLDFGHPMTIETVNNVRNALLNAVSLMAAYCCMRDYMYIILSSVINTKSAAIKASNSYRKYYNDLLTFLYEDATNMTVNVKVTVQEYKKALKDSLHLMMSKLADYSETYLGDEKIFSLSKNAPKIELLVITKKSASLLNDILKDVVSKISEGDKHTSHIQEIKCRIIQISGKSDSEITTHTSQAFDGFNCQDNIEDLNTLFKTIIFQIECQQRQQQLQITLSNELDLVVECDLYNSIIDPALLKMNFQLCNDFMIESSNEYSLLGLFASAVHLNVIYRIPILEFPLTLFFGISRQAHATKSKSMTWNESLFNRQIFEALCQNLADMKEGLVAEGQHHVESFPIKAFYFLTSSESNNETKRCGFANHLIRPSWGLMGVDGNSLMINCIAPGEMILSGFNISDFQSIRDSNAFQAMRTSLQQIPFLNDLFPNMFSSGLYECLRNQMKPSVRKHCAQYLKEGYKRKRKLKMAGNKSVQISTQNTSGTFRMTSKLAKTELHEKELQENSLERDLHPALLPHRIAQKYRKAGWTSYNPPELDFPHLDN